MLYKEMEASLKKKKL